MKDSEVQNTWTELRFEYYISARLLIDAGFFKGALIMISYAIETSYKALISEYKLNEIQKAFSKIKNSHDLVLIHNFCASNKITESVEVSKEFLDVVSLNFNRYPKQVKEARKEWFDKFGGMAFGVSDVIYFDDLMIQLNDEIVKKTKSESTNIISKALRQSDSFEGCVFFHYNFYALARVNELVKKIKKPKAEWTVENLLEFNQMNFKLLVPDLNNLKNKVKDYKIPISKK